MKPLSKKSDLTAQQRSFVEEYVLNGGHGTNAAVAAGYSNKTADVQASRLLTKPKIREAINRNAVELAERAAPIALQTLIGVLSDPQASHRDKIIAAREILDRGPVRRRTERAFGVQVNVDNRGPLELIKEIEAERQARISGPQESQADSRTTITV